MFPTAAAKANERTWRPAFLALGFYPLELIVNPGHLGSDLIPISEGYLFTFHKCARRSRTSLPFLFPACSPSFPLDTRTTAERMKDGSGASAVGSEETRLRPPFICVVLDVEVLLEKQGPLLAALNTGSSLFSFPRLLK